MQTPFRRSGTGIIRDVAITFVTRMDRLSAEAVPKGGDGMKRRDGMNGGMVWNGGIVWERRMKRAK